MKNTLRVMPQLQVEVVLDWKFILALTFLVLALRYSVH